MKILFLSLTLASVAYAQTPAQDNTRVVRPVLNKQQVELEAKLRKQQAQNDKVSEIVKMTIFLDTRGYTAEQDGFHRKADGKLVSGDEKTNLDKEFKAEFKKSYPFETVVSSKGAEIDYGPVACEDNTKNAFTIICDNVEYVNKREWTNFVVKQTIGGDDSGQIPKVTYKGANWRCVRISQIQVACTSESKKLEDGTYIYDLYEKSAAIVETDQDSREGRNNGGSKGGSTTGQSVHGK